MDWESVAGSADENDVRLEKDNVSGAVNAVWIRWQRVDHLYNSTADDRYYVIEPAQNLIRFGDGRYGMIPPAQSQVVATYDSGGGVVANVPANTITELHGSVAYLESVSNPVAAEGGADLESSDRVDKRGPQRIRHRDRAVTAEDFEWLAQEASPDVYHVRCLPLLGEAGFAQRGWVTLIIVPKSPATQPQPTAELRRQVLSHVTARTPAAIATQVRVGGPEYVAVSVVCEIVPKQADSAAVVEAQLRTNLQAFLHPVTGGPEQKGWRFGEAVYLSQIAKLVEVDTDGVDYAIQLRMTVGDTMFDDRVPVDENKLIASGKHEIKITLGGV
jgi:predicted phage baseplate assembly protein